MATTEPDHDHVMRTVRGHGGRFVRLWFVDVAGLPKSFAIPVSELEEALEDGVGIDGSSLEGGARRSDRDAIAYPDPRSFQVLPWRPDSLVARMFCDVRLPGDEPFPTDPRYALRRALECAAELGLTFQVGPEIEFFLFSAPDEGSPRRPLDEGAYFDLTTLDVSSDFRRRTIEDLEQMSIPVKASHHEVAASQHEIDLGHIDALSMADAITTFRLAVREVARELGVFATFMPKPLQDQASSGMHLHLSLFRDGHNAFYDGGRDGALAETGRHFLAGLLAHVGELTAVTNAWVNSYKRLCSGFEAPRMVSWTRSGDGALVRVPSNRPRKEAAARIELRSPDPACNPYLALALLLAAGVRGLERKLEPPPEATNGALEAFPHLPRDLREATDLLAASGLAREAFGAELCDLYVRSREAEWETHQAQVTEFERERLLRVL